MYDLGVVDVTNSLNLNDAISKRSESIETQIHEELKQSVCNTLCIDEWTNVLSNSIINFTVINDKGKAFLLDVVDNSLERNTTSRIAELTDTLITTLRNKEVTITGLITDNCNAMRSLKKTLITTYPYNNHNSLVQVGCCCHILAIILKRVSQLQLVNFAMDSVLFDL